MLGYSKSQGAESSGDACDVNVPRGIVECGLVAEATLGFSVLRRSFPKDYGG